MYALSSLAAFHAEAQVAALHQQQPAVQHSQQQACIAAPSKAALQSPDSQQQILDILKPYDSNLHGQRQTAGPSVHVQQHQAPGTAAIHDIQKLTTTDEQLSNYKPQASHNLAAALEDTVGM